MSKVKSGQKVSVDYVGTLEDGTEFDSSQSRGEPLSFQVGSGQLIAGFDEALPGMAIGETKNIKLEPGQAYGDIIEEAIQTVPRTTFPDEFEFTEGSTVIGQNASGQKMMAKVNAFNDDDVTLDYNHPMAGKTLNFKIKLLSID